MATSMVEIYGDQGIVILARASFSNGIFYLLFCGGFVVEWSTSSHFGKCSWLGMSYSGWIHTNSWGQFVASVIGLFERISMASSYIFPRNTSYFCPQFSLDVQNFPNILVVHKGSKKVCHYTVLALQPF